MKPYAFERQNMTTKNRRKYVNKWMIVIKAVAVAAILAGVKFVLTYLESGIYSS